LVLKGRRLRGAYTTAAVGALMNDRIHQALDGELDIDDLTPVEREQLATLRAAVEELAHGLLSIPAPDLSARIIAALPTGTRNTPESTPVPPRGSRGVVDWLWRPRE